MSAQHADQPKHSWLRCVMARLLSHLFPQRREEPGGSLKMLYVCLMRLAVQTKYAESGWKW